MFYLKTLKKDTLSFAAVVSFCLHVNSKTECDITYLDFIKNIGNNDKQALEILDEINDRVKAACEYVNIPFFDIIKMKKIWENNSYFNKATLDFYIEQEHILGRDGLRCVIVSQSFVANILSIGSGYEDYCDYLDFRDRDEKFMPEIILINILRNWGFRYIDPNGSHSKFSLFMENDPKMFHRFSAVGATTGDLK